MSERMNMRIEWRFVLRWMAANALGMMVGQAAGQIGGILLGGMLVQSLGDVAVLLAFAANGFITGALLGLVQRYVMQQEIELNRQWIWLSGLGWAICYPIAALVISATDAGLDVVAGSLLSGLLIGVSIGVAQWWVMRRMVRRAEWWVVTNTVGWLLGPQLATLGVSAAAAFGLDPATGIGALVASALIGLATGIFSGIALNWLMRYPLESEVSN